MEKYIKADTILKFINGCLDHEDKITDIEKAVLTGVKTCVERIPAADVVEVVRCLDCVYWRGENDICKGICIDFSADGYCSEGKRKNGGQDDV